MSDSLPRRSLPVVSRGLFRAELAGCGVPVVELTGAPAERLARPVRTCDDLLAAGRSLADPIVPPDSH
ncbi:hypothetical protein [Micromonospora parva]|uniref:hypothetical protein n=1 Tax=Micromonospora parva TaxID=1464048 RepID=UPI0033E6DF44